MRQRTDRVVHVGNEQRHTYGHWLVADPWGHVIAKASDGVGVVSARIDPGRVKKVRDMIPVAHHKARIPRDRGNRAGVPTGPAHISSRVPAGSPAMTTRTLGWGRARVHRPAVDC